MTIELQRYQINGFDIFPFKGSVDAVTYYGYDTTYSASAAFEEQETMATTIYLYEDITTGNLSLHVVMDAYENSNSTSGEVIVTVGGLPSSASIVVQDDPGDDYTWVDSSTVEARFNWSNCCTDGMVIDNINDFSNLSINVDPNGAGGVDKFKLVSSNNKTQYTNFSEKSTIQAESFTEQLDSYLYLQPEPSIYTDPITISTIASDEVDEVVYTVDGTDPTLAEYLAYDNQDPPNPFIAVVEDGLGNVLFDGGFPKWYDNNWDSNWTVFSDMNAEYKYLANALEYISNSDKVEQGNKDILIIGDSNAGENYSIKDSGGSNFNNSFSGVCSIMGYTPTFKTRSDYGGQLDMTFSELNQYCALILMSSNSTSDRLITENAVDNVITSREQGNGILMVSDHGTELSSLDEAMNTTYNGFFRTANYIAVRFNAYFTGDVDRSNVNVGYLRSEYGDHPLWNNLLDSEYIPGAGSESSVVVPETQTYPATDIPLIDLNTEGYHTYKYLLRLNDGSIVTESYTYGLNVSELVEILDSSDTITTSFGPTNFNNIQYDFNILPGGVSPISGYIKENNLVVGDFIHDGSSLSKYYYTYDQNNPFIEDNDQIVIEINDPLEYVKTATVSRNQRDLYRTASYGKRLSFLNRNEWEEGLNQYVVIQGALESINRNKNFNIKNDFEVLRNYMLDLIRFPTANTLIYDDQSEFDNAIQTSQPPTPSEIFSEWGVFSVSGSTQEFYDNISNAPDTSPYNSWTYNETEERVIQTANVGSYTGFVNNNPLERYTHEVTLTSPSGDDDAIGVVIAHEWDGTRNIELSAVVTMGGVYTNEILSIISNTSASDEQVIATRQHDTVASSPNSGPGWDAKEIRVKVERDGDFVRVIATQWDDTQNYDPNSEVVLDLNSSSVLQQHRGPKKYGYSTRSQPDSTYIDIAFSGGLNYELISNALNGSASVFKDGTWESVGLTLQDVYNHPRVLSNPETGKKFFIQDSSLDAYWGTSDSIEIIGNRYYTNSDMNFKILNYDSDKNYNFTPESGDITQNNNEFIWSLPSFVGTQTLTVSDGTYSTDVIIHADIQQEHTFEVISMNSTLIPKTDIINQRTDDWTDNTAPIELVSVQDPINGEVVIEGSNVKFTSTNTPDKEARFTYRVSNSNNEYRYGYVNMDVQEIPPLITYPDVFDTQQGNDLLLSKSDLVSNDVSNDGSTITVSSVSNPYGGTLSVDGDTITFTPTATSQESAGFEYTASDGTTQEVGDVYINITPLPEREYLLYDDTNNANDALATLTPPTIEDIFNNWGRFNGSNFYASKTEAENAGDSNATAWEYLSNPERVQMPLNVDPSNGFISPDKYEVFNFEATITSPDTDNDSNGLVVAYQHDGTTSYVLALMVSKAGSNPNDGYALVYFENSSTYGDTGILQQSNYLDTTGGWDGDEIRLRVQRDGNTVTCYGTNWNDTGNFQIDSELTFDLSSDTNTQRFTGPQSYGYMTFSQPDSSYNSISFDGGVSYETIYDAEAGKVYEYNNGSWSENTQITIQDDIGYIRKVYNPETQKRFIVEENSIVYLGTKTNNSNFDSAKILNETQIIKVESEQSTGGASNDTRIVGLYEKDKEEQNLMRDKPELRTTAAYTNGGNTVEDIDWFSNNNIDPNVLSLSGGYVVFSDQTIGVIDNIDTNSGPTIYYTPTSDYELYDKSI